MGHANQTRHPCSAQKLRAHDFGTFELETANKRLRSDYTAKVATSPEASGHVQLIEIRRCHETSRDQGTNGIQEVDGSIPFGSTNVFNGLEHDNNIE